MIKKKQRGDATSLTMRAKHQITIPKKIANILKLEKGKEKRVTKKFIAHLKKGKI